MKLQLDGEAHEVVKLQLDGLVVMGKKIFIHYLFDVFPLKVVF